MPRALSMVKARFNSLEIANRGGRRQPFLLLRQTANCSMRPFLVIRRKIDRCDLLLAEYMACTPRNGRYSSEMAARKRELIERFASLP